MIHQECLQCPECANLSWCIKCTLQQANVEIVEAFTLAAVRSTMATCVPLPAEMDTNAPTEGYARLSICSLAGSLCELEADLQWSVLQLKQAIESSTGIPDCAQSLIFGVEALQDHNVLGTLQIPDGARVMLLRRSELQIEWLKKIRTASAGKDPGAHWLRASILEKAPPEIREDRLVVLEAVSHSGMDFQYVCDDLRADREIALAAVKASPEALAYAAPELCGDHTIVTAALKKTGMALKHAADEILDDRNFVDMAVQGGFRLRSLRADLRPRFGDCETVALSTACCEESEIQYVSQRLRADRCFALKLLKENPWHWR